MAIWKISYKKADFFGIAQRFGISPVTARLLRNRDIDEEEIPLYLHGTVEDLPAPGLLPGAAGAARILRDKIRAGEKIRIIGDYDVDGICSAYILQSVFDFLGADADAQLPDRIADGYGINRRLVEKARQDGVGTIITCDNGIHAGDLLEDAEKSGITVIVTDHHEIPFEEGENGEITYRVPKVSAVVEPKLKGENGEPRYSFPDICGAFVTYKLAELLLKGDPRPGGEELLSGLKAFCALATVCDVMPLTGENRIMVKEGLAALPETKNAGLSALLRGTLPGTDDITAYHAGFVIGPCLNASGRLDSAELSLKLFMEKDPEEAARMAAELVELNRSRRSMTEVQLEEACALAGDPRSVKDKVLVLVLPECHESLAGIVAGRIRERYARPAFVLTQSSEDPTLLKGSGRSVDNYDMYAEMTGVKDLFEKFGGHRKAAGLTIRRENADLFRRRITENCRLKQEDLQDTIHVDMELPPAFMTLDLVREMEILEPFGEGNQRPLFAARDVYLKLRGIFGHKRNVLRFDGQTQDGSRFDAVLFAEADMAGDLLSRDGTRCHIVYYPKINSWNGRTQVQIVLKDWRPA